MCVGNARLVRHRNCQYDNLKLFLFGGGDGEGGTGGEGQKGGGGGVPHKRPTGIQS